MEEKHQSEVARILAGIQAEYAAAQQGLTGLAQGTCRHAFITTKMENMGRLQEELQKMVGKTPAMALIIQGLDELPEQPNA